VPKRKRGRPVKFAVVRAPDWRPTPAKLEHCLVVLPRYGKLVGALLEISFGRGIGIVWLARQVGATNVQHVYQMLGSLERVGIVSWQGEDVLVLHKLPPVFDVRVAQLDPSPWHGRSFWSLEAFDCYPWWLKEHRRFLGREYHALEKKRRKDDWRCLKELVRRFGDYETHSDTIRATMSVFLAEAHYVEEEELERNVPAQGWTRSEQLAFSGTGLHLARYAEYRKHGPTIVTFYNLYTRLRDQIKCLPMDGNEAQFHKAGQHLRKMKAIARAKHRAANTSPRESSYELRGKSRVETPDTVVRHGATD